MTTDQPTILHEWRRLGVRYRISTEGAVEELYAYEGAQWHGLDDEAAGYPVAQELVRLLKGTRPRAAFAPGEFHPADLLESEGLVIAPLPSTTPPAAFGMVSLDQHRAAVARLEAENARLAAEVARLADHLRAETAAILKEVFPTDATEQEGGL